MCEREGSAQSRASHSSRTAWDSASEAHRDDRGNGSGSGSSTAEKVAIVVLSCIVGVFLLALAGMAFAAHSDRISYLAPQVCAIGPSIVVT